MVTGTLPPKSPRLTSGNAVRVTAIRVLRLWQEMLKSATGTRPLPESAARNGTMPRQCCRCDVVMLWLRGGTAYRWRRG